MANDGANHPYLEEGSRIEFTRVKDHYYSKKDEVQVMITEHTDFTDKGGTGQSDSTSSTSSTSAADSSTGTSSHRNRSGSKMKDSRQLRKTESQPSGKQKSGRANSYESPRLTRSYRATRKTTSGARGFALIGVDRLIGNRYAS